MDFTDQEYREMDRGGLLMWLRRLENSQRLDSEMHAAAALQRLGGLMGAW
ncbi:hypothetical protein [Cupriavidus necator]